MTNKQPILATRILPPSDGYRVKRVLNVRGGLRFINSNKTPSFTITTDCYRLGFPRQCWSGGADHESIEKYWPGRFSDLIALHLSNIDGAPLHAEPNGWYNLAGYFNGAGERYHRGNSNARCVDGYRKPTSDECLALWAKFLRLPFNDAKKLADRIAAKWNNPDMKAEHARVIAEQRPRWRQEAIDCIARHKLTVFGDAWPIAKESKAA